MMRPNRAMWRFFKTSGSPKGTVSSSNSMKGCTMPGLQFENLLCARRERLRKTLAILLIGNPDYMRLRIHRNVAGPRLVRHVAERGQLASGNRHTGNFSLTTCAIGDMQSGVVSHFIHPPSGDRSGRGLAGGTVEQYQLAGARHEQAVAFGNDGDAMHPRVRRAGPRLQNLVAGR